MVIVFTVLFSVFSTGCSFKERQYGKFTEEQIENMAYAQTKDLPKPSGGVALSVLGETLTADQVVNNQQVIEALAPMAEFRDYEIFQKKARPTVSQIVISKASDALIYHAARRNAQSNIDEVLKKAVETEISKHVANYENNYALAEKAFKDMGFVDWNDFKEYKKKLVLTQFYMSKKVNKDIPIMHRDMIARYNALKKEYFQWDGLLKMRVIDIQPEKLAPDEIDTANSETKNKAAVRKAIKLIERIKAGEDFGKIAEANTHGVGKSTGGLWENVTMGSLADPYDVLEKAAEKMEAGDVSNVIEVKGHVFIMKLEDKRPAGTTPFTEVQDRIEAELKIIQQRIEYNKIFAEIVQQADIKDLDIFTDYCLKRAFIIITGS